MQHTHTTQYHIIAQGAVAPMRNSCYERIDNSMHRFLASHPSTSIRAFLLRSFCYGSVSPLQFYYFCDAHNVDISIFLIGAYFHTKDIA